MGLKCLQMSVRWNNISYRQKEDNMRDLELGHSSVAEDTCHVTG